MSTPDTDRVYRLDRFTVPAGAHAEFLARVRQTHELLRAQPRFVRDVLLEKPADDGDTTLVTLVEWQDADAVPAARAVIQAWQTREGFSPPELIARLGIVADLGEYREIER